MAQASTNPMAFVGPIVTMIGAILGLSVAREKQDTLVKAYDSKAGYSGALFKEGMDFYERYLRMHHIKREDVRFARRSGLLPDYSPYLLAVASRETAKLGYEQSKIGAMTSSANSLASALNRVK